MRMKHYRYRDSLVDFSSVADFANQDIPIMNIGLRAHLDVLALLTIAILIVVSMLFSVSPTLALHEEAAAPSGFIG